MGLELPIFDISAQTESRLKDYMGSSPPEQLIMDETTLLAAEHPALFSRLIRSAVESAGKYRNVYLTGAFSTTRLIRYQLEEDGLALTRVTEEDIKNFDELQKKHVIDTGWTEVVREDGSIADLERLLELTKQGHRPTSDISWLTQRMGGMNSRLLSLLEINRDALSYHANERVAEVFMNGAYLVLGITYPKLESIYSGGTAPHLT